METVNELEIILSLNCIIYAYFKHFHTEPECSFIERPFFMSFILMLYGIVYIVFAAFIYVLLPPVSGIMLCVIMAFVNLSLAQRYFC